MNKPAVISLNQAREKMREPMVLFESLIASRQNQAHREHWVDQLAMFHKIQDQLTMYKEPPPEARSEISDFFQPNDND